MLPAVPRIARGQAGHHPVAHDLGDDRGARDRVHLRVAIDDVRVGPDQVLEPDDPVPIDHDVLVATEPGDRATHREMGRMVDVELIDLAHGRGADAHGDGTCPDQRREPLALGHREGLRVADAGNSVAARPHDHRGRDDRPAGRGDADLVDAGDPDVAVVPEAALVAEGRNHDGHRRSG